MKSQELRLIGYRRRSSELLADAARAMGRIDLASSDVTPGQVWAAVLDYFRVLDFDDGRRRVLDRRSAATANVLENGTRFSGES
ncbi:MAG: hypothetical protein QM711_04355 [Micropruina sp.]|uniref:hypothetical protein n=1 Tax=Micropruina sp. TaxID=2737536 RepID=UPI0039E5C7F0